MSVVFHRSAGKMILKSLVATFVFGLAWIKSVAGGTSYSNVYVQSGPSLSSLYGPVGYRGAQLAPLAAAPLMSSLLPPCVSPCVIPSQQVAAIAPVATSSANFVSYNSPVSVPVVVAPTSDEGANYQYSYVVYDENTGDQKAQKESSDGGVVRGEYSLIQPDGYVREVQYTADDISGFNAVVKNFLPNFELKEKIVPPCPDAKNEPIKESPKSESHDLEPDAHGEESHEDHEEPKAQEEHGHEEHAEHEEPKAHEEHDHEEHAEHEEGGSHEENKDHKEPEGHEEHSEHGESVSHEEHGHGEPESQVNGEHGKQEEHDEHGGQPEGHDEHTEHGESESHEGPAEHGEPVGHSNEEHVEHGESESHEEPPKHGESEGHEELAKHEEHKEPESHEGSHEEPRADHHSEENSGETNVLVSYNDIIKCIQAAIKGYAPQPTSPLTYIVLNKPC